MLTRPRLDDLVDLVLPRCCVGCGRAGVALCPDCRAIDLHDVPVHELTVIAAARYDGGVRSALLAYKERGRRDLRGPLASMLSLAVGELAQQRPMLVPVPSTAAARRARGGDHLVRLARGAGRCRPALRLVRQVRDSAGLDTAERAANLHDAMCASRPSARQVREAVIIVDDITTTGATLLEAARALRAAGWPVVGAAVIAATPRRYPRRADPAQLDSGARTYPDMAKDVRKLFR